MKKKILFSIVAVALFAVAMAFNSQEKDNALADEKELRICTGEVHICASEEEQMIEDANENCDVTANEIHIYEEC